MINKDLKSKAKKGRFFPKRFGDLVRIVKNLNLIDDRESRIALRMENIEGEFVKGIAIFDYVPKEQLAMFSLSEDVDAEKANKAFDMAITKLSTMDVKPKDNIHSSYFAAYLTEENNVLLTRVDLIAKLKRYRGQDKLKNARYVGTKSNEVKIAQFEI